MLEPFFQCFIMGIQLNGHALINLRHLFSQVPASCMDDEIMSAIMGFIDLDEMIPAAQSADTAGNPGQILQLVIAVELLQIKVSLLLGPDIHPGRHDVSRFIESGKINRLLVKSNRIHATADVHADDVRYCLVCDCHRRTNRTAFPGMDVRHNPHPAPLRQLIAAHAADLFPRFLIDTLGIRYCRCNCSFNPFHCRFTCRP